jgi:calcium-dependent protein kinase
MLYFSLQLLSAINHCESRGVLHRDIKPENIMFKANTKSAELRLIDFGCGTLDLNNERGKEHVTFAGTAFYNSPEMFQKRYTSKTDVFSAGVVLYVLVAGYPADRLQAAFNLLHKAKRDLKTLPGMPDGMPDT